MSSRPAAALSGSTQTSARVLPAAADQEIQEELDNSWFQVFIISFEIHHSLEPVADVILLVAVSAPIHRMKGFL